MSDLAVLARLKKSEMRNKYRLFRERGRFKTFVILCFSLVFWVSLFEIFYRALFYLRNSVAIESFREEMIESIFHIFFFALGMMLVFSNAIIGYASYYKSRETGFLFALPVRSESIFLYKFSESLAFSSWAFLFLGTPVMAAYMRAYNLSPLFFFGTIPYLFVFLFIPAAIGSIVAMMVTVYIPRTKKTLIGAVVVGVVALGLLLLIRFLTVRGGYGEGLRVAREIFESIDFTRNPLLPSAWLARAVIDLARGNLESSFFFLGVLGSNAFFLCALAHAMSIRFLPQGWFVSQSLRTNRRYAAYGWIDFVFGWLLGIIQRSIRFIVIKDVKSFIRDPVQWSQFLIFFGLLAIYFLNLRTFAYEERNLAWKNLIAQMNLLATSLTLSTFASRFIFPQLSLEGRRFWIIGMVPIPREQILVGKLVLSFSTSVLISELLIAVSSYMLQTPWELTILHSVTLFGVCLAVSGMSVGLGAVYPNFQEDSPSKIVAGFGGTLNLVLSLLVVLVLLGVQAVPCFLYYTPPNVIASKEEFRQWVVAAIMAIGVLSLIACLVPMSMGLKAIRKLEI